MCWFRAPLFLPAPPCQTLRALAFFGILAAILGCAASPAPMPNAAPVSVPRAQPDRFAVAVAALEGDVDLDRDGVGDMEASILQALRELNQALPAPKAPDSEPRFQILELKRALQGPGFASAEPRGYLAHEEARNWLEKMGAHLLIWGKIVQDSSGNGLVLRLTGTRDREGGNAYPLAQEFQLPGAALPSFYPVLKLAAASEAGGFEALEGRGLVDELPSLIQQVEGLMSSSKLPLRPILAYALHAHAMGKGGAAWIQKAEMMWKTAELDVNRSEHPVEWALLYAARASVLSDMDILEADSAMVQQAVEMYGVALQELRQTRTPLDWALTQNNLGLLYRRLAERLNEKKLLCFAVDAHWKAAEVSHEGKVPRYMDISLRGVQRNLSALRAGLPPTQKPACQPPIADTLWLTFLAGESK